MGTEVLRAQDCLGDRLRVSSPVIFHGRRHYIPNGYPKTYRKPTVVRTEPKKRFSNHHQQPQQQQHQQQQKQQQYHEITNYRDGVKVTRCNNNGETRPISIMRRGVSLDCLNSQIKREGENMMDVYAGSAFSVSPCPSSVPLPSFSRKRECKSFDDSATRDLRRLLRLE